MAIQTSNTNLQANAASFFAAANSDNMAGMRMAAPVVSNLNSIRMAKDSFNGASTMYRGARMMNSAGNYGGVAGRVGDGLKGAFSGGFKSFLGALKSNFIVSAVLSGVSNLYEMATGKVKPLQAAGNFVADTAAYTGIGAASTTIGGFIGSLIPIPVVGTLLGVLVGGGVGLLLGKFYEDKVRTSFSGTVQQGIQSLMNGGAAATTTSTTIPTTPVAVPAQ